MSRWIYAFASAAETYMASTWPDWFYIVIPYNRKKEAYLRRYRRGKKVTK